MLSSHVCAAVFLLLGHYGRQSCELVYVTCTIVRVEVLFPCFDTRALVDCRHSCRLFLSWNCQPPCICQGFLILIWAIWASYVVDELWMLPFVRDAIILYDWLIRNATGEYCISTSTDKSHLTNTARAFGRFCVPFGNSKVHLYSLTIAASAALSPQKSWRTA